MRHETGVTWLIYRCDGCADTVKKPKLDQHRQRCYASFTCLGELAGLRGSGMSLFDDELY